MKRPDPTLTVHSSGSQSGSEAIPHESGVGEQWIGGSPEPTTYAEQGRINIDDEAAEFERRARHHDALERRSVRKGEVPVADPRPYGADLPAPNWANADVGPEAPLGFRIDDQDPVGTASEIAASLRNGETDDATP